MVPALAPACNIARASRARGWPRHRCRVVHNTENVRCTALALLRPGIR
jgi:hypothetical protein